MKTFLLLALFALLSLAPRANARPSVSFEFFYDNLDPYGEWVDVPEYGYCWHPTGVDAGWAPYTDGYWAYTDGGWTWVSYEDFGGITYHYGRWSRLEDEGWCWVPDYEWAPAWVSWRSSDDYIGWAPLPPRAHFRHEIGISVWSDVEYDIGPTYYNFCEFRHFGDPALRPVIIDRSRNVTFINRTTNITNITVNRTTNNIFVGGPQFQTVAARSARPVQVLKLRRETDLAAVRAAGGRTLARQQGNQLVVLAPEVAKGEGKVKPSRVARTISAPKVDRGWNGVQDPQVKERLQHKFKQDANGLTENSPAKQATAEDLKIVEEKAKAPRQAAAQGTPRLGKGKKGSQPADLIAQPEASAAASPNENVRKGKDKKVETEAITSQSPEIATPLATPNPKAKAKAGRKPAEAVATEEATAPAATPGVRGKKAKTENLQPFAVHPDQTQTPAERKSKRDVNSAEQSAARDQQRAAAQQAEQDRRQRLIEKQQQQSADAEAARARRLQERDAAVQERSVGKQQVDQSQAPQVDNARKLQLERAQQQQAERVRAAQQQRLQSQEKIQQAPNNAQSAAAAQKGKKKAKEKDQTDQPVQ